MRFTTFISCQALMFFLWFTSMYLIGFSPEKSAMLASNILTFIPASWIMMRWLRHLPNLALNVLSVTISFNLVTYLLLIGAHGPLPSTREIVSDFIMILGLTLIGIFLGLKYPKQPEA
ncbi:MAG: hypothetical protein ACOY9Y_07025 [Bacillota bacterium]